MSAYLGIELGSTRIKAVLIGDDFAPLASGAHDWENSLIDGYWTYSLDDVWEGIRRSFRELTADYQRRHGSKMDNISAIGISAMMHGYLPFDRDGVLLTPFRTWRNTNTGPAAEELTKLFDFNIPLRWSIAHLYQAALDKEPHLSKTAFITTLAGYVHWQLTGEKVVGIGDASGMFPIQGEDYHPGMLKKFDDLNVCPKLKNILPKVLSAGMPAGVLTAEGAARLDPSGILRAGTPLCPPEGDAGTGMVATNSVAVRTGNVSAGTSIFAMAVLESEMKRVYPEIDMITTPAGRPVAMVHCNNCTSDLDAWVRLFSQLLEASVAPVPKHKLYDTLYFAALEGAPDCGGLLSYNYYGGEPIADCPEGRPLFVRLPDAQFTLANFSRTLLLSTMTALKMGMDILEREQVRLERMLGHGGLFKTEGVGRRLMAAALNVPVAVMDSAGEGGPWGIALLAAYLNRSETLEEFLNTKVFANANIQCSEPEAADVAGFNAYMERYTRGLAIERAAGQYFSR